MPNYQLTAAKMEFILAIFKLARYVDLKFSKALPGEKKKTEQWLGVAYRSNLNIYFAGNHIFYKALLEIHLGK